MITIVLPKNKFQSIEITIGKRNRVKTDYTSLSQSLPKSFSFWSQCNRIASSYNEMALVKSSFKVREPVSIDALISEFKYSLAACCNAADSDTVFPTLWKLFATCCKQ